MPDIVAPFEPPISGLLRRSTSLGFLSFGCFVVMLLASTLAGGIVVMDIVLALCLSRYA